MMRNPTTVEPTRMTADDAWGRFERGEPIFFIDSRNPTAWGESDIKLPGALRVPADRVESHLDRIPKDRAIVTYCTWPHEASSARVAQELMARGFEDVHPLLGGLDAWVESGYPVERK